MEVMEDILTENKLKQEHLGSLFFEGIIAEDILLSLTNVLNSFDLKLSRIIELAMDGLNVKLKLFKIFCEFVLKGSPINCMLFDVGTCPIHTVHNEYKKGAGIKNAVGQ